MKPGHYPSLSMRSRKNDILSGHNFYYDTNYWNRHMLCVCVHLCVVVSTFVNYFSCIRDAFLLLFLWISVRKSKTLLWYWSWSSPHRASTARASQGWAPVHIQLGCTESAARGSVKLVGLINILVALVKQVICLKWFFHRKLREKYLQ